MEGCLSKGSVIIYVWRKKDAEVITEQLQSAGINGGVMCYHGGMDSNARSRAQAKVSTCLSKKLLKVNVFLTLSSSRI